tara:strand:+ start:3119 stop:3574 length:456 start_codon:yes stop_codon:yes gene_type:complete
VKKTLYIDMDGVLVDFSSGIKKLSKEMQKKYLNRYDDAPGIFALMEPLKGAVDAFNILTKNFDVYILTSSPWKNNTALQNKKEWVEKYLGEKAEKRIIFSHHKNLNKGDYLIDDRTSNGVLDFEGEHIHFGSSKFSNWVDILDYLIKEDQF